MAIVNTLAADVLSLRGYDSEYHRFSRFFRTRTEAENALIDGAWVPGPGIVNACVTADEGILVYNAADTVNGMLTNADTATRAYIDTQISSLIGDAPETLNTLTELAGALQSDPNYLTNLSQTVDDLINEPTFAGPIRAQTTDNIVPFYYDSTGEFPDAATHHGAMAHSHADGAMYFAHGGNWVKLQNEGTTAGDYATQAIGIADGEIDLGTFTGTTIADDSTVKEALQTVETQLESVQTSVSNIPYFVHASWDASTAGSYDFANDSIASSGVSDVTRTDVGKYRVTFDTPFPNDAYTVTCGVGSTDYSGTNASPREVSVFARNAAYVDVICERSDDAVNEDNFYMSVIVMR